MTRASHIILLASLLALPLSACGSVGDALDPAEWFAGASDLFNTKKKLPGDRKPVFPDGVPGVAQGIPPELVKGNQPQPENTGSTPATPATRQATATPATAAPEEFTPAPREKAKPKQKAKPKPVVTEDRPPTTVTVRRAPPQQDQQQQQQQQPTVDTLWPEPPPPARTTTQPGAMQWPDPPPVR